MSVRSRDNIHEVKSNDKAQNNNHKQLTSNYKDIFAEPEM